MKIKVCGLNEVANSKEVLQLQPDFIGFIFYDKSLRNCTIAKDVVKVLKVNTVKKVGVFVNKSIENVLRIVKDFGLDYVQLHGGESVEYCKQIKDEGIKIIKAFSVDDSFDMDETNPFEFCDYFLFDTKGENPGGNGVQFDWDVLKKYKGKTPFILSGGIELQHSKPIKGLIDELPLLAVLDINSKFEIKPGLKRIDMVEEFINEFKMNKHV